MREFCAALGPYAAQNSISRMLLRYSTPGVADTYQGTELWSQSLVDPDNRRPVDYGVRRARLADIASASERGKLISQLLAAWQDGGLKLFVSYVALQTREHFRDVFLHGDYTPVESGEHAVSFLRTLDSRRVLVCAPRLAYGLTNGKRPWALGAVWGDQQIQVPAGRYREAFTGRNVDSKGSLRLADAFSTIPLLLLVSEGGR
jgi:(1->4)-alpha-D-glucan 1-alpha-D-glucosylmutase